MTNHDDATSSLAKTETETEYPSGGENGSTGTRGPGPSRTNNNNNNGIGRRAIIGLLGAGFLAGSGAAIGGWLASDGEERDFSTQQDFDNAEQYVRSVRDRRNQLDREVSEEVDSLMEDLPNALSHGVSLGAPFGGQEGQDYVIAEANESNSILSDGTTPGSSDQYFGIAEEGVTVEVDGEELDLNIFARGGSVVDDGELGEYQNILEDTAGVYESALDELGETAGHLEDRVEEKDLPEQENHQESLEGELENYRNLEDHYQSEAETASETAQVIGNILGAERRIRDGQRVTQFATDDDTDPDGLRDRLPEECDYTDEQVDTIRQDIRDAGYEIDEVTYELEEGQNTELRIPELGEDDNYICP